MSRSSSLFRKQFSSSCPLLLPSLLLLLIPLSQATAKTVTIGKGSGAISLDSMKGAGLEKGDTVIIAKGTYTGGTFTNLTGVTIVPEAPGVTFTGRVVIGHDNKVTFDGTHPSPPDEHPKAKEPTYGYTFSGFDAYAFNPNANCQDMTIKGVLFSDIGGAIDGSGNIITYTGTPDTTLFNNLTVDTVKLTGKTTFYFGTWDAEPTYHNVNIGMTLKNVIVLNDGTGGATKVLGHSLYKLVIDTWRITGPTLVDTGDCGIFGICGNVTIKNVYRSGGWAYITRLISVGLGAPAESYIYNVIDVDSVCYGMADSRISPELCRPDAPIPLCGGNLHVYNVTTGNKLTMIHYLTPLVVLGGMSDGKNQYTTEIKNCIAFNVIPGKDDKGMNGILQLNCPAGTPFTKDHNIDITGPIPSSYFIDKDKFYPRTGSPLIGKGEVIPIVTTDIYGNPRSNPPDVGAVEHVEGMPESEPATDNTKDARLSTNDYSVDPTNTAPVPYRAKR